MMEGFLTDNPSLYRPCVGAVLINSDGLVFAGRRIDAPLADGGGAWQMPQGGMDEGEASEAAMYRELAEETSVSKDMVAVLDYHDEWLYYDLPVGLASVLWGGVFKGQRQKWYALRYLGDDNDINIATAEPEFSAWRWMKKDEIIRKIVPFKKEVYDVVFSRFERFLAS
jgi:putative (di)nucleoside polyphosphate hydrolase